MNNIVYNNVPCPVLKFEEPDSYLIIYKGEQKWIFESSLGYGEIIKDRIGIMYVIDGMSHRENEPAIINNDGGFTCWQKYDEYHRLDGPAVEKANGFKEYWIKGKNYYEKEYWEKIKQMKKDGTFYL